MGWNDIDVDKDESGRDYSIRMGSDEMLLIDSLMLIMS